MFYYTVPHVNGAAAQSPIGGMPPLRSVYEGSTKDVQRMYEGNSSRAQAGTPHRQPSRFPASLPVHAGRPAVPF
ncbi:MAG: hypothetical protein QY332_15205 [Anaerolineales bacterium]|nr:MAG: hypothetical protein QY332_15205 [Anaerolineales bacterium]